MVRRRNPFAEVDDWAPGSSVIDYVKNYRSITGKSKQLLEEYLLPEKDADQHYRIGPNGNQIFNLSSHQLDWIYPPSVRKTWNYEKDYDRDFSDINEDFLNELVPEITPSEDYFEKEELPVLYSQNTPLSSAPIDYISKQIYRLLRVFL